MDHYVGIDVSLELSSLCVFDLTGYIVREAKVASAPESLIGFLTGLALPLARIGLEAGPLSQWLHAALIRRAVSPAVGGRRACSAPFSSFVRGGKSKAVGQQLVLLAHGPRTGKAEALAQPQHGFEAADRTLGRVE
jgi:hypothetical protein